MFRPEIEGLRAVAVVLVFANHLFGEPVGGFTGVDVFFVISGFLITGLLEREYERCGRISIRGFYARRARRILPGALLVLAASIIVSRVVFIASRAHDTVVDVAWAAGFSANIHFAAVGTDYFTADRPASPVQHYWSLSVEEQFYVVWPIMLFALSFVAFKLFRRVAHVVLVLVVAAFTLGLFVLALRLTQQDPVTAYFSTLARGWELGVGALCAVALGRVRQLPGWVRTPAMLAGFALIALSAVVTHGGVGFPAPGAGYAVLGTVLVIIAGSGAGLSRLAWPLTNPASRYVGRVSYSLYLWHWPVIVFLAALMPRHDFYYDIAVIALAAACTAVSYHCVEDPLRRLNYSATFTALRRSSRRGPARRDFAPAAPRRARRVAVLCGLSLAGCALVAGALQPLPAVRSIAPVFTASAASANFTPTPGEVIPPKQLADRIDASLQAYTFPTLDPAVGDLAESHGPEWKLCGDVSKATLAQCTFPAEGSSPAKTLVVLGDSFGIAWTPAMRAAQSDGYTVVELTHSQCPAIDADFTEQVGAATAFTAQCNAAKDYYLSVIARLKPAIVVIANYDAMLNNLASKAKGQTAVNQWGAGAKSMIARVKAAGAHRIVLMTSPPQSGDLTRCDVDRTSSPSGCVARLGYTWTAVRTVEMAAAKAEGVTMLDTNLFFCSIKGECPAFVGTTPTHVDGHHLTGLYAKQIGPDIVPYVIGTKHAQE